MEWSVCVPLLAARGRDRFGLIDLGLFIAIAVVALPFATAARGAGDPCDGFQGPFEECTGPFVPYISATAAQGYPQGQTPFSHPGVFPLIQVCPIPVGAGGGEDNPDCEFTDLFVDVQVYPRAPADFICYVLGRFFPAGTVVVPPLDTPGLFPSGACPLDLTILFPDASVVCPGHRFWTGLLETRSDPIEDMPGGRSWKWAEFGYLLICVKTLEEAIARSLGVIPIVRYPWLEDEARFISVPFAVANRSEDPHDVSLSLAATAPWPLLTELPPAVLLEGGESTTFLVDFEIPSGTPVGDSNLVTLTVDLDGAPGTEFTEAVEVILVAPPQCGDGICDPGEDCEDCLEDCVCVEVGCIATGPNNSLDGYLAVAPDGYGSFTSGTWGGGNAECSFGDNYNPSGGAGLSEAVFTNGFVLYVAGANQRELLSTNLNWKGMLDDASLDSTAGLVTTGDSSGDGVDDTAISAFTVTGAGVDLDFELTQVVEEVGGGVSTLTQTYLITNTGGQAVDFVLLRQADYDLLWDPDQDFANDSVGTGTNGSPECDRHVYQVEDGLPETAVTVSSSQGDVYYGSRNGIDPDCGGDGVPFGWGTDFQQWDEFGLPLGWDNAIAGVGCATDGESGPAPAGCAATCDGAVGLSIPVSLEAGDTTEVTIMHTYGANVPASCLAGCGPCPTDADGNGKTEAFDLAFLLGNWGPIPPDADPAVLCLDADGNGTIGAFDLAFLLGGWGQCPCTEDADCPEGEVCYNGQCEPSPKTEGIAVCSEGDPECATPEQEVWCKYIVTMIHADPNGECAGVGIIGPPPGGKIGSNICITPCPTNADEDCPEPRRFIVVGTQCDFDVLRKEYFDNDCVSCSQEPAKPRFRVVN